jgi:hypothetical protein
LKTVVGKLDMSLLTKAEQFLLMVRPPLLISHAAALIMY